MSGKKQNAAKRRTPKKNAAELSQAQLRHKHEAYRDQWMGTLFGLGGAALLVFAVYGFVNADTVVSGDLHKSVAAETEHCQVTGAMLAYYFQEHVDSYLSYAASAEGAAVFDPLQPLDRQYYDAASEKTWYSFLMDTTMNTVQTTLKSCEAAYAAGYVLPESIRSEIAADAAATDLTHYQSGVTEEDVAQVMTMQMIARNYEQEAYSSISVTDAEIEAAVQANPQDYEMFSMYCFTFEWTDGDAESEQAAREHAQALSELHDPEAYKQYARTYMQDTLGLSESAIERRLLAMRMTSGYASYTEDVQTWIRGAKPMDTYILESPQLHYLEVLMLEDTPALDESECVDLRVLYLSASAHNNSMDETRQLADSITEQCRAKGSTPEAFAELVSAYSNNSSLAANGGLVEGYSRIRTTYGAETADWAFAAGRKQGDTFICERESAAIIAYYQGKNDRCGWENQVYAALLKQKKDAAAEKLTGSTVNVNARVQKLISAKIG